MEGNISAGRIHREREYVADKKRIKDERNAGERAAVPRVLCSNFGKDAQCA
jgi:hypothetical protein